MNRRDVLFFTLPILGFLIIALLSLNRIEPEAVGQRQNDVPAGEICGSTTVGQTFQARYPGLYRIDVLLATYRRTNTHDVTFHLRELSSAGADLVTIKVNARDVADNTFRPFTFPAIKDSAGKSYYFYLDSPESVPGDAITIWTKSDDVYKDGVKYVSGAPAQGDLAFLTYYRPPLADRASIILDRLTAKKPYFWGQRWFYVGLFAVYLLAVGYLFVLISRVSLEGEPPVEKEGSKSPEPEPKEPPGAL